ncbi:unnamed protein product, partial [Mesorhabditis belari]|uniref:Uncharacterized protein n=1 Tax=Mesorhabditis belari TaxID=2138241 RepID=A0AAF3ETM1_9BILA
MSVRYQAVFEADALSYSESTTSQMDSQSVHDKSPIIYYKSESNHTWKDLLRLPNDPGKRRLAIMSFLLIITFLAGFFLYLTLSGAQIFKQLSQEKANTKYGLQFIPDLRVHKHGVFYYSTSKGSAYEEIKNKYVNEIDKFLDTYWKDQLSRQKYSTDCSKHGKIDNKWCRFSQTTSFKNFNKECTNQDNYGFDSGEPCLLFAFKDEIAWTPEWSKKGEPKQLPLKCEIKTMFDTYTINATYFPPLEARDGYGGFTMNKIPSLPIKGSHGFVVDDDGEIIYDLPALIFVKLRKMEHKIKLKYVCSIKDSVKDYEFSNLRDFVGVREFAFTIQTFDDL